MVQRLICRLVGLSLLAVLEWPQPALAIEPPPFDLISEEEAERPDNKSRDSTRSVFPGPKICPVQLSNLKEVAFPVRFTLKLKAYGGADISGDSFSIFYWKIPKADLYSRIKQHNGIEKTKDGFEIKIEDAVIPMGSHTIRVQAIDTRGMEHIRFYTLRAEAKRGTKMWFLEPESGDPNANCD